MDVARSACLAPSRQKACTGSHSKSVLVVTLFVICSAMAVDVVTWTNEPADPTYVVVGENVTLAWNYSLKLEINDKLSGFKLTRYENGVEKTMLNRMSGGLEFTASGKFAFVTEAFPAFMLIEAEESDETKYCCYVDTLAHSNKYRECVDLKILVPPNITVISGNQTVDETDNVTLSCNATGKPPPNVTWSKQGNKEWKRLGSVLTLRNISRDQHGEEFWCTAKNNVSNATASVTISVNYAPAITLPPKRYNVTEGNDTELYCDSDGRPPPIVTWSKVGSLSNNSYATGQRLNIRNANRTEAGTYMCTATNGVGKEATATIQLNVFWPPIIERKPINQTLNETQELRLQCVAKGNPPPSITWTKVPDSTPIDAPDGVITINNVNKTHSGVYQCRASNGIESDALATSSVIVYHKPVGTDLISDAQNNAVITGHSVTFSCTADSLPSPELELLFNNVSLGYFINGNYTLQRVNSSSDGTYECVPRNFLGTGLRASLNLTVQVSPSIDYISHNITVNETDDVVLFCNASGRPNPTIMWTFRGYFADMEPVTLKSLSLPNLRRNQTGRYRCTATNGVTKPAFADVLVAINYKPEINGKGLEEIKSWINHETEVTCEAAGFPLPEIIWSRHGTVTSSVQQHSRISTLKFTPTQANDFGVYECTAKNLLGLTKASVTVKQLDVPDAPEILQIHQGFNNLEIHWKVSTADPKYPNISYMVQAKEKGESKDWMNCTGITRQTTSMMCVMDELKSNTEYIVRVSARNVAGYSEFTVKEVSTKEKTVKNEKQQGLPRSTVDWIIGGSIGAGCLFVIVVAVVKHRRSRGRGESREVNGSSKKVTVTSYDNPTMEMSPQTDVSE